MIVSRMHILTLLTIYILIGSMAYNANGDCYRPNFTNPYAILLDPDEQTYGHYFQIKFSCIDGHTMFGLPDITYCGNTTQDTLWNPDPSDGLCEAQCNTINLLDDDIVVMVNSIQETLVDSRTTAQFSCRDPGQFTGLASAVCTNGTFDYLDEPSCLAYCPVNLDELGVGLYYNSADDPVMNETNTLYYRDKDVITYICLDGYEGPKNRTPTDDGTSTCNDGSWDPPEIPTCMDIDDCLNNMCRNGATCVDYIDSYQCQCPDGFNGINCENVVPTTEMATDITGSPGSTSEPVLTTDDLDMTTMELRTPPTLPETEKPPTTALPCGGECKATQVCNAENNCECRPDYYEDEEDTENPCKEPESFDLTITITKVNNTNAEYKDELEDPSRPEFKKLEIGVCEPFEEIYEYDPEYKGCLVLQFSNGSIIVNYVLTFAENSAQNASTVNKTVQNELQNPNGSFTGDYEFDDSSLVVAPLDECYKQIDDCDPDNAICTDQGENGYTCECREGFDDVGIPKSLPGRECMKSTEPHPTEPHPTEPHPTEPQPTEPQPTDHRTTKEPEEPGLEPWKVAVGVTVPIIAIIIVGLTCWQRRRQHGTSSVTELKTIQYSADTSGSSDPESINPGSMAVQNDYDSTVPEVVLPLDDIPLEKGSNFVPEKD